MRRITQGVRLTDDERADLARDVAEKYLDGMSIRQIVTATGRSYGTVHRMLTRSGKRFRSTRRVAGDTTP